MNPTLETRQGFIYCLTHPSMPGICKIGATRKHPIQRARELSAATGVPGPYTLAYYRDFADCFLAETMLHQGLASYRVNESREFFEVTVNEVVRAIDEVVKIAAQEARLISEGMVGGEYKAECPIGEEYPFAALFASFAPSDSHYLNRQEQSQCRALESRLSKAKAASEGIDLPTKAASY
jgi:hypothetical protein